MSKPTQIAATPGGEAVNQNERADTVEDLKAALEELRGAEEEMRQQNEELSSTRLQLDLERRRYQELFDFAPGAYLVTDLSGIVRQANGMHRGS